MDALEERLLRELRRGGQLTADDLANRIQARHWVELSTALSQLARKGYVTVIGRPDTPRRAIRFTLRVWRL